MNKQFVHDVALFVLAMCVGTACLILSAKGTILIVKIMNLCLAAVDFIVAWLVYRRMRRNAEKLASIDQPQYVPGIKITIYGKEKSTQKPPQGETAGKDESPDEPSSEI